jgi:hypothetical protein
MKTRVILSPYDSGHRRKRMGCGPERIFEAGLKGLFSRLGIEFESEEVAPDHPFPAEINSAFQLAGKISQRVRPCRDGGIFPIVLSGNCNASVGTVSGLDAANTGIVWFDGHGEATTPETSGPDSSTACRSAFWSDEPGKLLRKLSPDFLPFRATGFCFLGRAIWRLSRSRCLKMQECSRWRLSRNSEKVCSRWRRMLRVSMSTLIWMSLIPAWRGRISGRRRMESAWKR